MNARNTCWVERIDGKIVRIFRSTHGPDWQRAMDAGTLETCPKFDAVRAIWSAIFDRSKGMCEYGCGRVVTRSGWTKGEMHEEVPRGSGGEISIFNSKMICRTCHRTDPRGHGNRRPMWSETT